MGALEGYKYDSLTLYEKSTFAGYELKSFGSKLIIDKNYFGRYVFKKKKKITKKRQNTIFLDLLRSLDVLHGHCIPM